jgi:tRNA(Ser,Leu) C12 N-acetylase TAN1
MREWNIVVTSLEGRQDALLIALRRLGSFWRSRFRNVIVGKVEDPQAFLDRLGPMLEKDLLLPTALARVLPAEKVFEFQLDNLLDRLKDEVLPLVERIGGQKFYVRMERRGFKGQVHPSAVEKEIGEFLWQELQRRGFTPAVDFRDPEVIVIIEMLGESAGIALVDREMRAKYPFLKVR